MDFTLSKYCGILEAGQAAGYAPLTFAAWFGGARPARALLLRHDVDRRPGHALAMARMEAARGIAASYYFRAVGPAWNPEIITAIAALGHEIGYHYEDLNLAGGDMDKARAGFAAHLARLRGLAPVASIAMHGSPLGRWNNLDMWPDHEYRAHGVEDVTLSIDYADIPFFTDSGRTFGDSAANLRDHVGSRQVAGVDGSDSLASWLAGADAPVVCVSTHPERWTDAALPWARQWGIDMAANTIKRGLRLLRGQAA